GTRLGALRCRAPEGERPAILVVRIPPTLQPRGGPHDRRPAESSVGDMRAAAPAAMSYPGSEDGAAVTPPTVSVVLPTHNRPIWLAEALTSVLDGQFQDLEVVVSNNGNPEHTRSLPRAIGDPRGRWIE